MISKLLIPNWMLVVKLLTSHPLLSVSINYYFPLIFPHQVFISKSGTSANDWCLSGIIWESIFQWDSCLAKDQLRQALLEGSWLDQSTAILLSGSEKGPQGGRTVRCSVMTPIGKWMTESLKKKKKKQNNKQTKAHGILRALLFQRERKCHLWETFRFLSLKSTMKFHWFWKWKVRLKT